MTMMRRTMMDAGARRSGRTAGWRGPRGLPDGRASLCWRRWMRTGGASLRRRWCASGSFDRLRMSARGE